MLSLEVLKPLRCARCGTVLPNEVLEAAEMAMCPSCNSDTLVRVFPAILNAPEVVSPEGIGTGTQDATCFFHPFKAAAVACSQCGRFLCRLCEVEFHGENWCPECITSGTRKKKVVSLENRRMLYDSIALMLATLPLALIVFWMFSILTAPAALFISIRYWRAPGSLVRRTKLRLLIAMLLAFCETGAWVWGIGYWLFIGRTSG